MTFLRNYHWKDYTVESLQSTPTMGMYLHRGKYPIHRLCSNVEAECRAFNLTEVYTWINSEKWNILWVGRGMGSPIPGPEEGAWTREGPKVVE